jgi:hypothetical protein
MGLNKKPHRSQLRTKMIKGEGNDMGKAKIWVSSTWEGETHDGKTFEEYYKA